jgi:rSAM/selenodomain-associated transferase 2
MRSGDRRVPDSISIIIPALNEEEQIAGTLDRIVSMTGSDAAEVIVADGGSRDATRRLAVGFARVRTLECARAGRGVQMNAGATEARGDILLFLHADARPPADALEAIRRALREPGVAGGCFEIAFPPDAPPSLRIVSRGINWRTRRFRTATGDQGIFLRRAVFDAIGGFRDIPLMEDIALFNELKQRGRVVVLPVKLEISPRRWLKHGVWRTVLLMYALRLGYWLGIHPATLKRFFLDVR